MSIQPIDISHETQSLYRIDTAGEFSFVARNRTGEITFDIAEEGARVTILLLFEGVSGEKFSLATNQIHSAPGASSELTVKSVLRENASVEHHGTIRIEKHAQKTDASFASRHLLLDTSAHANVKPHLEILANDVRCRHAAATSPPNGDLVFFLRSRGIAATEARNLLAQGFLAA